MTIENNATRKKVEKEKNKYNEKKRKGINIVDNEED